MTIVLDFFNFLSNFFTDNLDITILVITLLLTATFATYLTLTIKKGKNYVKPFLTLLVIINLLSLTVVNIAKSLTKELPLFFLLISSFLYFIIEVFTNKKVIKREEKELIDLINLEYKKDIEVKEEVEESNLFEEKNPVLSEIKNKIKEQVVEDEICLDHAKNVIEKLKEMELSFYDKKAVKEIEYTLLTADGEIKGFVKERVNESLQELLKIMAKYQL